MTERQNEAFRKRLLETFAQEAKEHIDTLSNGLVRLKSSDRDGSAELVETLFREAHSFKGAARSVDLPEIEEVCKAMEDVFGRYKQSHAAIPPLLIEAMLEGNDLLGRLAVAGEEGRRELKPQAQEIIRRFHEPQGAAGSAEEAAPLSRAEEPQPSSARSVGGEEHPASEESGGAETIRIPVHKLNAIMRQSEEMLFAKMACRRHTQALRAVEEAIGELHATASLSETVAEGLKTMESAIHTGLMQAKGDEREIGRMVDHLIAEMKEALMLPFSTLFYTLPKMVHDMAKSVGKEVVLNVRGGDIQIDRRILEEMHDPLIHLLRNAVDHGIESPEERVRKGKKRNGSVTLTLTQKSGSKVELSVRDDGKGIEAEKIALSAVDRGVVDPAAVEAMDHESRLQLIFQSGVSTAPEVTDLSGRGLGLAIVQEKAQRLGGDVVAANLSEGGSEFIVLLPLSMATFRGVVTSLNGRKFIFPSEQIVRVTREKRENIRTVEGKEMLRIDRHVVPFYPLHALLELPAPAEDSSAVPVVVIGSGSEMAAIGVEEIEYEEEVMVKSLGKQLLRVRNIAGAALLSSDVPALILNVSDLFKSAGMPIIAAAAPQQEGVERKARILVADDSPTTRALLQNIMEMAGYEVRAAGDGLDAFERLKAETFDLVVSDVDMPRMNGFELTGSIRSDTRLAELPVVLVTSMESQVDREKGMRAGANAYIVKSTFDQNNLLETVQWLIE